jgi:hypothetical protein
MEASCQAAYDQDDFDTHSWFKLYPPDAEIATNNERQPIFCEECKRNVGSERTEGKLHLRKIQTDSPISLTSEGDLLLRNDFVRKFKIFENDSDYSFRAVSTPDGKLAWSVVDCAPVASRLNVRRGFCTSCGNATKSDQLPEVEETYILSNDRCFFLSPDLPRLPCFSRGVIEWLIDTSECLSLDDFKPIELVLETPSGSRD